MNITCHSHSTPPANSQNATYPKPPPLQTSLNALALSRNPCILTCALNVRRNPCRRQCSLAYYATPHTNPTSAAITTALKTGLNSPGAALVSYTAPKKLHVMVPFLLRWP